MRRVHLGARVLRDQPVAGDRHAVDLRRVAGHALLPGREIERAGKRRQHDELREGHTSLVRKRSRRFERRGTVTRQAEDE